MALRHAILATILDEPQTGYELAKQFGSDGFYWRATHQQIYRELERLETEGLVAAAAGGPGVRGDRKRGITGTGRQQLADWARSPAEPASIKEDLLVKCLTVGLVPRAELAEQLAARRMQHLERLRRYEAICARLFSTAEPLDDMQLGRFLALQGGISYERAWVEWAEIAVRLLRAPGRSKLPATIGP